MEEWFATRPDRFPPYYAAASRIANTPLFNAGRIETQGVVGNSTSSVLGLSNEAPEAAEEPTEDVQ
jgi:hypothetical protein